MWNRATDSNSTSPGDKGCSLYVHDEEGFYVQSLCAHVAVINYFYTFALGMWVLSCHQSCQLLWCLSTVSSRPPRDQHPLTPLTTPVLSLIKLVVIGVSLEA